MQAKSALMTSIPLSDQHDLFSVELRTRVRSKNGVEVHIVLVSNVMDLACLCRICKRRFSNKSALMSHINSHFEVENNLVGSARDDSVTMPIKEGNDSGEETRINETLDNKHIGADKSNVNVDYCKARAEKDDVQPARAAVERLTDDGMDEADNDHGTDDNCNGTDAGADSDGVDCEFDEQMIPPAVDHDYISSAGDNSNIKENVKKPKQKKSAKRVCEVCGKKLRNERRYIGYMRTHVVGKPYVCTTCGTSFKKKPFLERHCRKHEEVQITKKKIEDHVCGECGKHYTSAVGLKKHGSVHTGVKPFLCTICGKRFRIKQGFKEHLRNHTGEKPHICNICGKSYNKAGNLKLHVDAAHGERILCTYCGKTFSRPGKLLSHVRVEHEGKRYPVKICGKILRGTDNLRKHLNSVHSGDKKFPCSECGEKFNEKIDLENHFRKHTGEKPYVCSHCDHAFRIRSSLMRHLQTVHGERKQLKQNVSTYYEDAIIPEMNWNTTNFDELTVIIAGDV